MSTDTTDIMSTSSIISSGSLYRSEDMLYVRLLMSDDAAYDTIKQLGVYGQLHIIDLSHQSNQESINGGNNDRIMQYKKRVQNSVYYEKKLLSLHRSFVEYNIDTPSIDTVPQSIHTNDIIDYCHANVEPIESQFMQNVLFKKQQLNSINKLLARLNIVQYLQQSHINTPYNNHVNTVYGSMNDGDTSDNKHTKQQNMVDIGQYDQLRPMRDEMMRRQQPKPSTISDVESQYTSYQSAPHLTSIDHTRYFT